MEKYIFDKSALPVPVLPGYEDWVELYYKAWEMAFDNVDYIEKEGWKPVLTCMPGVGVTWQWDSCIMTFLTNYSNGTLSAFNNLDNLYRLRRKSDGFMAMAYNIEREDEEYPGRINPPLMAWAEWEYFKITGDDSRFDNILPAIAGFYNFIENNRKRNCGLYWYEDSGSSGMDNSPRSGYHSSELNGSDVCHVDLACQQALTAKYLSKIYNYKKNCEQAEFYTKEHERICNLINEYHWSNKGGFYYDFFARDCAKYKVKLINSKTAAAFWTLLCGAAKGEKKKQLLEHMLNPDEFYTKIPFASLSKDDLNYDPTGGYWLGGVWPPTNLVAIRGLWENGYKGIAREVSIRYLDAISKIYKDPAYGSIWEAYAPEDFRPSTIESGALCRKDFVGWGGIAPITLLIENIIGLNFDSENNTITFDIPGRECGLLNMNFNCGKVSIECTEYKSFAGQTVLKIKTQKPFNLSVKVDYLGLPQNFEIPVGESIIRV